jgi:TruD family tRNA pseudouridine synthase
MEDRLAKKKEELEHLTKEFEKSPELFPQRSFIENSDMLGEFGIYIPGKEDFLTGVLKLWPEDFIVEEIGLNKNAYTVTPREISRAQGGEQGFVYATLVKCNMSTIEAANDIAHTLGVKIEDIFYSGMKDKDAFTSQRIAIKGVTLQAVADIRSPYFFLKDIEAGNKILKKGELEGNRFTILIRTEGPLTSPERERVAASALTRVNTGGFYNFFYLQRFGLPRLCNYHWALDILKGHYEHAVLEICTMPGSRETPYVLNLRKELKNSFGNWSKMRDIIAPFPIIFFYEHLMLEHLLKHPNDFVGALQRIEEQVVVWMSALTAIFFNQKISDYLLREEEPPQTMPFFISPSKVDQQFYRDMLSGHGLYPVPLKNLAPFQQIKIRSRQTPTKDHAKINKGEILEEGLLLEFELGKGQYATTFLSHLFNLVSGKPPADISEKRIDTKKILGEETLEELRTRFQSVIHERGTNMFEYLT